MHTTIDYSNSPAPAFDAVYDIMEYFGDAKYNEISPQMSCVKDHRQFQFYCMIAGIEGFPVKAWYEHYHGQGTWIEPTDS